MSAQPVSVAPDFLLLTGFALAATVADIESTKYAQRDPDAAEVNSWIYGERPQRSLMYGINVPVTAAFTWLAYYWKRRYARGPTAWLWRAPLIAVSIGHGAAAMANYYRFRRPAR